MVGDIVKDLVVVVLSVVILVLGSTTELLVHARVVTHLQVYQPPERTVRCHILIPLLLLMFSTLIGQSIFHTILTICFSTLLCKWSISNIATHLYLSRANKVVYFVFILLDYAVWSTARFWVKYITVVDLDDHLSFGKYFCSKLLQVLAFAAIEGVGEEEKEKVVKESAKPVKSKWQMRLDLKWRVLRTL